MDRLICNPCHERTDREFFRMSNDERTRVCADVGGVQEVNPEDPESVRLCLQKLDEKLARTRNKSAFETAQMKDSSYTDISGFRILFLRADNFDVDKSYQRMLEHFEAKLNLFGENMLARDITLQDFNKEDLETLKGDATQILPQSDQFGRRIICSRQVNWRYKHRENLLRTMWYFCMSLLEDENVQRGGIVGLGYSVGEVVQWSGDFEMVRKIIDVLNSLPARILSIYTSFNSRRIQSVVDVAVRMFNAFLSARFRAFHGETSCAGTRLLFAWFPTLTIQAPAIGTRQECNYQLMPMGITHTDLRVGEDGTLLVDNHTEWLCRRRQLEAFRERFDCTVKAL